jgi:hypothetical protein
MIATKRRTQMADHQSLHNGARRAPDTHPLLTLQRQVGNARILDQREDVLKDDREELKQLQSRHDSVR